MQPRFVDTPTKVILLIGDDKIPVAKYVGNKVILCDQFAILNSLFTYPMNYIPITPRPIPSGTSTSRTYYSTGLIPNCKYLTFETTPLQVDDLELSRVVTPRRELIQLFQLDMNYTIHYDVTDGCIQFLVISQNDNKAYPLVDTKGYTTDKVTGKGYIIVAYYQLIIIKTFGTVPNVKLVITGTPTNPIADRVGEITLKLKHDNKVVSVPVAFKDQITGIRTPVPGLSRLANLLFNTNRSMFSLPCTQTQQIVTPPGPYSTTIDPPSTDTSINLRNMSIVQHEYGGAFDPSLILRYEPFGVTSPYWSLTNILSNGQGTGLWLKNFIVNMTYGGTYHLRYDIIIIYPMPLSTDPEVLQPSFFMLGSFGEYFYDYVTLCNGTISRDTNGVVTMDSLGNTKIHYSGDWRFSNSVDNTFVLGFYPGIDINSQFTGTWTLDPTSFIFLEITSLVANCFP